MKSAQPPICDLDIRAVMRRVMLRMFLGTRTPSLSDNAFSNGLVTPSRGGTTDHTSSPSSEQLCESSDNKTSNRTVNTYVLCCIAARHWGRKRCHGGTVSSRSRMGIDVFSELFSGALPNGVLVKRLLLMLGK